MIQLPVVAACSACKDGVERPFPFSMAFQPIVNTATRTIYAYEALVRGPQDEGAAWVLAQITPKNCYAFDQNCRVSAITLAAGLGLVGTGALLAINFMPGAVYSPEACIQLTLKAAETVGFPCEKLIFEITESEKVVDRAHLRSIVLEYHRHGFKVAIDDFGAEHSNFNLLAGFPVDILKLDMELTRNLHQRPRARAIMRSMVALSRILGSELVAEGVETIEEYMAVRSCGIVLMQGYLFARPTFETLPPFSVPNEIVAVTF